MLENIKNIAKTAVAFLQTGKAPPNISEEYRKSFENKTHLSSKKFFIIFTSILMLLFMYYTSVAILWELPKFPEIISAYVTVFSKTMEIFAIIIATYLGTQAAVDLKYNSSSRSETVGISETIDETITTNTKEDDYKIDE